LWKFGRARVNQSNENFSLAIDYLISSKEEKGKHWEKG
jgi:hypothetical protein